MSEDLLDRYLSGKYMTQKQGHKFLDICISWIGKDIILRKYPKKYLRVRGFNEGTLRFYFEFEKEGDWIDISEMIFPGGFQPEVSGKGRCENGN